LEKNLKNESRKISLWFALLTVSILSACSSHKKVTEADPSTQAPPETQWNYDKIRQVREDEKLTAPIEAPIPPQAKLSDDCQVTSAAQMKQAKLTGCKLLDPRLGYGENTYCCPRIGN
jgi:hypothetical protein